MEPEEALEAMGKVEKDLKPKRSKSISVRAIHAEGESVLVEWNDDGLHRAFIPVAEVSDGKCSASVLKAGIPYGVDWGRYIDTTNIAAAEITQALYRAGFWIPKDIEERVVRAQQAINQAVGISAAGLRRAASNDQEE